jgi:hypothetical protein
MTDRKALEDRATALGIQFTDGWKDSTLENRIAAQEQQNAAHTEPGTLEDNTENGANGDGSNHDTYQPMPLTNHITVTGPAKGRWRIGKHFTRETQVLDLADLTGEQIAALKADPELVVSVVRSGATPT